MTTSSNNVGKIILGAGLLTGSLDGAAAVVQYLIKGNKNPEKIFQYIASAVFGKDAFTGGNDMVVWGVVFHFSIAMIFTVIFFFLYPLFYKLFKNKVVIGIFYGSCVWAAMNLVVVPMSNAPAFASTLSSKIIATLILIFMIGLPNAFIIGKYYERKEKV